MTTDPQTNDDAPVLADLEALAAKAWEHQHPSMKWRDAAPLFRDQYLSTTKAVLAALRSRTVAASDGEAVKHVARLVSLYNGLPMDPLRASQWMTEAQAWLAALRHHDAAEDQEKG